MKVNMVFPGGGPYTLGTKEKERVDYAKSTNLPILLSTRASILFWKICGVVEEEKLLLVITFSSGFFFLR